jgi:hypothetical protein
MAFVLVQVATQRLLQLGLRHIKDNPDLIEDIFGYYGRDELSYSYGPEYIDRIKGWLASNKIPVVQAWNFDSSNVPGISVKLSQESEAIDKAAMGDLGYFGDSGAVGVGVMQVNIDIGIHTSKTADEVLWLYYIASYILFRFKPTAERLGLELYTFSATDHQRADQYLSDNMWTRWIRLSTTVQNTWCDDAYLEIDEFDIDNDAAAG